MTDRGTQLRGAFSAGFKKGIETLRSEKWKAMESEEEYKYLKNGEVVKLLVPTLGGYMGNLVVRRGPNPESFWMTSFHRPDKSDAVDACPHEMARKIVIDSALVNDPLLNAPDNPGR